MGIRRIVTLAMAIAAVPAIAQMPAPTGMVAMSPGEGYRLGTNDEVEVTIYGATNSVTKTRIKEDGTITLPYIGAITARDRTAREFSNDIAAQLRSGGYLVKPVVSVDVTQYVSNSVTVFGQVANPGVYPLDRATTVGMMLARSGGARAGGADYAILRRSDGTEHRVLGSSLEGEWSNATPMMPGDTLFVPTSPLVYVYGQVNGPGTFEMKTGMTVRQAMIRAGGPTLAGSQRNISIYRAGKQLKKVGLDDPIEPDDALFVHERVF